jgi:hypothetical protein
MSNPKTMKKNPSEQGQVLVLLVLGMVALLGFTALAVDGGMVYADRRQAQNASDASSLAGGSVAALYLENHNVNYVNWNCAENVIGALNEAETSAIARAADNGYGLDDDISDNNGAQASCELFNNGSWIDRYVDVRSVITADTETAFAHFVFPGPLRYTVEAITRIRPRTPLAYGNAIVALDETTDCNGNQNGVLFGGSITVNVHGGGIFSNGCLSGNGNGLVVNVEPGTISHVGEYVNTQSGTLSPAPVPATGGILPPSSYKVDPPDCSQVSHYGSPSDAYRNNAGGAIPPGNYSSIKLNNDAKLLAGGLYCLYGDFDAGSSGLTINTSNGKQGVTIYLISGSFSTNGNGQVALSSPPAFPDPSPAIPGILIYLAETNTGLVKLRGNSSSSYIGTILAPAGTIDVAGTSDHEADDFNTQLIGKNVVIGGNADIEINFKGTELYMEPSVLELAR